MLKLDPFLFHHQDNPQLKATQNVIKKKMIVAVAPAIVKRHTASELRDVDEMEGSVQRVQTVEHESKEE